MRPNLTALATAALANLALVTVTVACTSQVVPLAAEGPRGARTLAAAADDAVASPIADLGQPVPAAASCASDEYVGGGRCYADADSACIGQGCDHCDELETAPVQIICMD